ncbi:helix-turn-helix domain-containing protein [Neobacillus cucumis]|uniref:helix-turn-helix domain-containing protein n=1 Tax=Neobacillus cucumis TaxID=1740721 RepID=UPI0028531728|nr:helix-turn-helix transcriptional regulator [Neobacillus cucumis]MDR4946512.1 helix-turn-helix transcriptional regulator [Neobacillus cucumis]
MEKRLPYGMWEIVDYRYIKQVRFIRNKTQKEMAELMDCDHVAISRLERGEIALSPLYKERFIQACKRLKVSSAELVNIRESLELKNKRGYK